MDYKILFVVYTPFEGYLPKRMAELESRVKLDNVSQVVVTPDNYPEKLAGLEYDTVHLIKLYPDNEVDPIIIRDYYAQEPKVSKLVEGIKVHNM